MAKRFAGKRWFEAMGRRANSKGLAALHGRQDRQRWPMWARQAYAAGWLRQQHRFAADVSAPATQEVDQP